MRLAQITDSHIGADWLAVDPVTTLRQVVDAMRALPQRPDVVLHTGDLTHDGTDEQYAALTAELDRLELPYHVLPGNHDDRATMRRHFPMPGFAEEPIQYVVDLGELQVLMLDTVRPGEAAGELDAPRRDWLAAALHDEPGVPALLAMHHPPFLSGLAGMDALALPQADREALAATVAAHPQVCGIVAGHVHRGITATVAGRPVITIPSSYAQSPLDFATTALPMVAAPLGFAVHTFVDGRLVSHLQTLAVTGVAA